MNGFVLFKRYTQSLNTLELSVFIVFSTTEILSFTTSHYAIGMQLIVVCNYLGHICNYKFGIV